MSQCVPTFDFSHPITMRPSRLFVAPLSSEKDASLCSKRCSTLYPAALYSQAPSLLAPGAWQKATWTSLQQVPLHLRELLEQWPRQVLSLRRHLICIPRRVEEIQGRRLWLAVVCSPRLNILSQTNLGADTAGKNGLGTFNSFPFKDTLTSTSVTGISVQGSYTAPINLDFFILKSLSRSIPFTTFSRVLVRVAVSPLEWYKIQQYLHHGQIKTSLSTTTSTLTATSYYGTSQPLSPTFKLVKSTKVLTYQKTIGAYRVFQGVLNLSAGDVLTQDTFVDVVFGTRRTPKLNSNFWDFCDNSDPLTCA